MKWAKTFTVLVFSMVILQILIPFVSASPADSELSSLNEAEAALAHSYEIVLAAEKAGANISFLIDRLNQGGIHLSEAYMWYSVGASGDVDHYTNLCYNVAKSVESEASELLKVSQDQQNFNFISIQLGSVTAVALVLVLSYVIWRIFKRRYCKAILSLKPMDGKSNDS